MKKFLDDNFLLQTPTAEELYFKYAKDMPIFDYHCHLNPQDIYENKTFHDLTQVWLVEGNYGDHYKWRLMRANGVSEDYITGNKTPEEKFAMWAKTLQYAIGNPIYHWCHLELKNFFGIEEVLNEKTKDEIYKKATAALKDLPARKLIEKSNVKVICTTDDPADDLKWHLLMKEDKTLKFKVLPAFRPDKAINIELDWYLPWVEKLSKVSKIDVSTFKGLLSALSQRIEFFDSVGCKISDHALDTVPYCDATYEEVEAIYLKRQTKSLTSEEVEKYKTYMLKFFGKEYTHYNWAQQYHISAMRNNNQLMFNSLGADTGFDAINDQVFSEKLSKLLNALAVENNLPKTILYSLNPNCDAILATIAYCFQSQVPGKLQLGSAWWFNDHIDGMTKQLRSLANCGLLAQMVGMLTDSRSFLSYPRHDYFRRILCNFLGGLIENGEYPNDLETVGKIVQNICYYNACKYFGIEG